MTKREIYQSAYSNLRSGGAYLTVKAFQRLSRTFGEVKATQFVLLIDRRVCDVVEVRSPRLRELVRANRIRKQDEAPNMGADSSRFKTGGDE
ncbi:hypothetical protein [Vibrio tritonius]|uniref:hypothetical protein n=1 Tax=Vibrio tritonius TaxID=1435069 RepID=UPI00315C8EB9